MNKKIALIGNPNCGKTTLFNYLTGSHQKTGNWTGVTTEKKEGKLKKESNIDIIDLPGLYSFDARSSDEKAVLNYLEKERPDAIINVVDGTNLERNLYLTTEILALKIPTVIAVTFYDEIKNNNIFFDEKKLSLFLGVPVVPISAVSGENVNLLIQKAKVAQKLKPLVFSNRMEKFEFIKHALLNCIKYKPIKSEIITSKLDKILMSKSFGLVIFAMIMTLVYFITISLGSILGEKLSEVFDELSFSLESFLNSKSVSSLIISLVCGAIIKGMGVVSSFLPQILILFTLLSIMEESGYASRASFIIDGLFEKLGLSGRAFIPIMLSCGCTVSGLMATRTIENEREKKVTIFLSPFMPCGAKTAVFGWFSSVFFNNSPIIATSMYFIGIFCVALFGKLFDKMSKSNSDVSFIMEIPTLRIPRIKDIYYVLTEKVKDYVTKASAIIFLVSLFLWALRNLGATGYVGDNIEKSFLFIIGEKLKYIFYPIGVTNWQSSVALISGIFAKEAVIESIELLSVNPQDLFLNNFSAYAYCTFILLAPPCIASISQAYHELKSKKLLIFMILFQTFVGYLLGSIINFIGILWHSRLNLILSLIIVIIVIALLIIAVEQLRKNKCRLCKNCKGGINVCKRKNNVRLNERSR